MTASWLNQMGWDDVYVLEPEGEFGLGDITLARGPRASRIPAYPDWPIVRAGELSRGDASALGSEGPQGVTVIDLSTSLRFRRKHIPGAWWAVRARLAEARDKIGAAAQIVLTSDDGLIARYAAPEAALCGPSAGEGAEAATPQQDWLRRRALRAATARRRYKPYDLNRLREAPAPTSLKSRSWTRSSDPDRFRVYRGQTPISLSGSEV
jgi:hypothetical protein